VPNPVGTRSKVVGTDFGICALQNESGFVLYPGSWMFSRYLVRGFDS
jgi:hypothetical protein